MNRAHAAITDEAFIESMANMAATVTVITAIGDDGVPRGCTVSAFCSISREPPLVLVSIGKTSRTLEAIQQSGMYTVNLLKHGADRIAMSFAGSSDDKFDEIRWRDPALEGGGPVFTDAVFAYLECDVVTTVEAGDHWVFVGRVVYGEPVVDAHPLVYYRRSFRDLAKES
jgi:flavin reductase (DIM6/NTAB) family NADH-FMN oxidoreductase RutF